jgi:hypothetical protein
MTLSFFLSPDSSVFECREDHWCAIAKNGISSEFDKRPVAFFPLLERSIKELSVSYPVSESFPWSDLIKFAGDSSSAYWQSLALERIEELEIFDLCADTLKQLVDHGLSQQIRHRAQRLLKLNESKPPSGPC